MMCSKPGRAAAPTQGPHHCRALPVVQVQHIGLAPCDNQELQGSSAEEHEALHIIRLHAQGGMVNSRNTHTVKPDIMAQKMAADSTAC